MTLEKQILALMFLLVVLPITVTAICPREEDIAPCTCQDSYLGVRIECGQIDNEELANVASHLANSPTWRGRRAWTFTIVNSTLGSIPHDVFKGLLLRRLRIRNSTLSALTDGSEALVGLEDQLEGLEISDCFFESKWDWSVLRNLSKLEELHIFNSLHLETIGEDILKSSASSVRTVSLRANNISSLSDHAFESFKNIESLSIDFNNIKDVKRTMLPNPALKLRYFSISWNQIEQFPEDMFTNMQNLRNLYIHGNKILFLDEKTFSPVWEVLETLFASSNPLDCDCRMSWLVEKKAPENLYGFCASPPKLKGKELSKLQPEDFVC